jgi:hypothetical protein
MGKIIKLKNRGMGGGGKITIEVLDRSRNIIVPRRKGV